MPAEKLPDRRALEPLLANGWAADSGRDAISKTFIFRNFIDAFGFMNHHPEWSNVYKTVNVTLITHDVNGLSELDLKLARKLDALAQG
jgi:4a-hydroxytetrahydrobiopterin dehydratase